MNLFMLRFYPEHRSRARWENRWTPWLLFHTDIQALNKDTVNALWRLFMSEYTKDYVDSVEWDNKCLNAFYRFLKPFGYVDAVDCGEVMLRFTPEGLE
jgi:hypothetical protein